MATLLYIATGHQRIDLAEFKTQTITSKVHPDKISGNIEQIVGPSFYILKQLGLESEHVFVFVLVKEEEKRV